MIHVNGIDISDFQNPVNMTYVQHAGYSFMYAKATQGADWVAQTYLTKMADARNLNMLAGAYHFFDWKTDPVEQAAWFLDNAKVRRGDLPPLNDVEVFHGIEKLTAKQIVKRIATFNKTVEKAIGAKVLIYMNPDFWANYLGKSDGFNGHTLWLAQYGVAAPDSLGDWKPSFWQYSSKGNVPGISGYVDTDWFLGTRTELEALRLKGTP